MTQKVTPSVNMKDAPHSRNSYWSHSNQSIGYNKESSGWCLHDPKEHKEERDLVEIGSKCATFYISYTHSQYFLFSW